MNISVHLFPSDREHHEPGHMCLSWQNSSEEPVYRGYVFRVQSLPVEFRNPRSWRDYLFTHTVPGVIVDDLAMRDRVESKIPGMLSQCWQASASQVTALDAHCPPGDEGLYSFNPDDHPGAHNCVTWSVAKTCQTLGEVLPRVRQGRIKLMAAVLRGHQAPQTP
jgi:hypothetical protein